MGGGDRVHAWQGSCNAALYGNVCVGVTVGYGVNDGKAVSAFFCTKPSQTNGVSPLWCSRYATTFGYVLEMRFVETGFQFFCVLILFT